MKGDGQRVTCSSQIGLSSFVGRFLLTLLSFALVGCHTHQHNYSDYKPAIAPDIITTEFLSDSPVLTRKKVESLRSRLSKQRFKELGDLKAALPDGFLLAGMSYTLKSTFDSNGQRILYTESVFVCRLNEEQDLIVVEDNRSGKDCIQNWFIRDLPIPALQLEAAL